MVLYDLQPFVLAYNIPIDYRWVNILIVSPEFCSERDYVITHFVHSKYMCMNLVHIYVCMYYVVSFAKLSLNLNKLL